MIRSRPCPAFMRFAMLGIAVSGGIGCSEKGMADADSGYYANGTDSSEGTETLRLDLYPSSATPGLEPQSFSLDDHDNWEDLRLPVSPTITYAGTVLGYTVAPYTNVPGESNAPVYAEVRATLDGSIAGASTLTDEEGRFQINLPAGEGYGIAVIPQDTVDLPFFSEVTDLLEDTAIEHNLDFGVPLYGIVSQNDNALLPENPDAYLVDDTSGVESAIALLNNNDHFMIRALPGTYTLVVEGDITSFMPRVETAVTIEEGFTSEINVELGELLPIYANGRLVDSTGTVIPNAVVRFYSSSLTNAEGTVELETETDKYGQFDKQLLPGSWTAEFIPEYDETGTISPLTIDFDVDDDQLDFGDIYLSERTTMEVVVINQRGVAVPNVVLTATELGFNGYSYSGITDEDGLVTLDVPDTSVEISLTPPNSAAAITRFNLTSPDDVQQELQLSEGDPVSGKFWSDDGAIAYALVEIRNNNDELLGRTFTDGTGDFSVRLQSH